MCSARPSTWCNLVPAPAPLVAPALASSISPAHALQAAHAPASVAALAPNAGLVTAWDVSEALPRISGSRGGGKFIYFIHKFSLLKRYKIIFFVYGAIFRFKQIGLNILIDIFLAKFRPRNTSDRYFQRFGEKTNLGEDPRPLAL